MADSTIISASLSDKDIRDSINKLVVHVDKQMYKMVGSTETAVELMKNSLKSLGDLKINFGGSASNNIVSKLKSDSKEISMTLDQTAQALQRKASGNTIIETYDIQLALLKDELKSAESQLQSFLQMSRGAGEVGNEGLFKFATSNLHEQEAEVERLRSAIAQLESQRENMRGIMQPQGDALKNYVQDLQKANPELALLNQQYKNGTALLQQKGMTLRKSAQEEQEAAKESAAAQQKLSDYVSQSANRQEIYRQEIIKTGLAAQKSAQSVMAAINEQMASGDGKQVPTEKIYELLNLFKQMNAAYYTEGADKESPMHKSLKNDMEAIREVIKEVSKYNNLLFKENMSGGTSVTQRSTVESLRKEISSLTNEFNRMTIAQINAGKADGLINNLLNANRAAQVLQKTISRPIDLKSAMGLQANTLDEIAYKMQMLRSYREGLNILDPTQKAEIEQVNAALKDLEKTQREVMGENESLMKSNNALARSFNYMKNRLAFYFTVGAATQFIKQLIDIRSQYELAERSLGILINSAEKGTQVFKELSDMALVSPYTLIELSNAAKQLSAYGVEAKELVNTTRKLADASAAVGAPVERLAYALGHVQSYGYLTSLQARQFANSGIPLVKELANQYSELEGKLVTTADVYDRMKKKQVEYADVMQVINRMTDANGRFYDFQRKQADTLRVQLANLNLAWNNFLNDLGKDNQGKITFTISALRKIFLAWKDINKAMWDVIYTFGAFKSFQFLVLLGAGALKTYNGWVVLLGKRLTDLSIAAGKAFAALAMNPTTWIAAAGLALMSFATHIHQVKEAASEMNRELAKNAKEASESLSKYLNTESAKEARENARNRNLSKEDANKTFEDLRNEIELSSANSVELLKNLYKITDENERLTEAFDLADKIQQATSKLSGLNEDAFKVSQDSLLNGLFGEGLAEDIEDYMEAVNKYSKHFDIGSKMFEEYTKGERLEAEQEMKKLADDMKAVLVERLGSDVSNPTILGEAIERIRKAIKDKNPQIKGEVAQWFDIRLDELLSERFNGLVNKTNSIQKQFLEILKRDYSSAFSNLTDDIYGTNGKWTKGQEKAIKDAAENYKKTLFPAWRSTIDEMVSYMNNQDWRITIATEMGVQQRSELQAEWDKRVSPLSELYKYRPSSNQNLKQWGDEQRKAIQGLNDDISAYERDRTEFSKEQIESLEKEKQAREDALDVFKQSKTTKDDIKNQKAAETELQKALKEEIQLLDKARSIYKQLTKEGVASNEALTIATEGYEETITHINSVLQKYGIQKFNLAAYAGVQSPHAIMELLQGQLDALVKSGVAKPEEIKDLQIKLKDVKVDEVTFNQKTLTDSLNNELNKLKDEYELAVELDANPELGDLFTSMFGIDKSELSSNIEDYMRTAQAKFDELVNEKNWSIGLNIFKASNEDWTNWANTIGISQEALKELSKEFVSARDFALKYFKDIINKSKDLEYKFADTNGKIALKEEELANLRTRLSNETNEIVRNNIRWQIRETDEEIAKLKEELYELLPIYKKVFGSVSEHSNMIQRRLANNLLNALKEAEKKGKNSRGNYTFIDPDTGEKAELTAKKLGNEIKRINEELRKSQSNLDKFVEALTKGEDGVVDIPKAFELANAELVNMSGLVNSMKKMSEVLGTDQETLDMLDEIGGVIDGIGETFNGISKMASGDIFGGMAGIIGGLASAIGSIFGGAAANNKITEKIEKSEMAVKRLENAYINLNRAVEKAYGTEQYYAKRIAAANKQAQLYEVKRQLQLEKSRSSKYHDEEKIIDLERQALELGNEIDDMLHEIINDFMGISSVSDAIESMVGSIIESLRSGEDALESFDNSIDDMIANMVKKVFAEKLLGEWFDNVWKAIEQQAENRAQTWVDDLTKLEKLWANRITDKGEANVSEIQYLEYWMSQYSKKYGIEKEPRLANTYENIKKFIEEQIRKASEYTVGDIRDYAEMLQEGRPIIQEKLDELNELLRQLGLMKDSTQNLSNLQQGIQGITETTANALEAYMNGVSQQVYLHSDLLTQIRDAVVGFDMDVQLATQAQILMQLQASYQVQMSIQSILAGWSNASGQAVRVEMI